MLNLTQTARRLVPGSGHGPLRYVLGFGLAPLTVPALFFLARLSFGGYAHQSPDHLEKLVEITSSLSAISYSGAFALGLPIVLALRLTGRLTLINCAVAATSVGALAGLAFSTLTEGPTDFDSTSRNTVLVGLAMVSSLIVSVTFCLVAGVGSKHQKAAVL